MSKNNKPAADFEATLAELEKLIGNLEKGEQSLDESLTGFKRGIDLARQCQLILDNARQTVDQLVDPEDEDCITPFKPDA